MPETKNIGKTATLTIQLQSGTLDIDVKIKDVKRSYGKIRYLITPLKGTGEVWAEKLKIK